MEIPSPETRTLRAIEGYQLGHFPSLKAAAQALEVPVSTVYHRASGRASNVQKGRRQLALDGHEEKVLIDWIFRLHRLGIPCRPSRLRDMTDHIRQARATTELPPLGPNWASRFIARHSEIKSVLSSKLDKNRWDNVTRESMEK
jgi:hypothetical protein